jgi:hypothetical protein
MNTIKFANFLSIAIIILIMFCAPVLYCNYAERKARRSLIGGIESANFRISGLIKVLLWAETAMSVLIILWAWRMTWGGLAFAGTIGLLLL